jgi:hypothetical protein
VPASVQDRAIQELSSAANRRNNSKPTGKYKWLLSGMTFCDCDLCRERAEPCSVSGIKNGRGTRYYRSYRKNRFDNLPEETGVPRPQCGVKHVRANALEGLVLA